jgi:hypothetical protein
MPNWIGMLRGPNLRTKPAPFVRIFEKYGFHPPHKLEPKKKIIETSFWVALRRCAVHLVPVAFSLVIITLNAKGYYIGADFASLIHSETLNLLLFQIAAKVQELLVVASLTTIIFHLARQELLFGNGLPLGLIGSGLLFSDAGYFLSKEFWGSLKYKAKNKWRKWGFLASLVLAGGTAALVGPSSATLLVPKTQYWQAGGTSFYMNGNSSDFWPISLSSNDFTSQPYCFGQDATKYGICPSGGFRSLWEHYGQIDSSNYLNAGFAQPYAKQLSGSSFYWKIDSPLSQVPPVYALGGPRRDNQVQDFTFFVQSHAATTIMAQQITTDWWNALLSQKKLNPDRVDDRVAQTTVLNPAVQVRCSAPQNISNGNTDVQFPTLSPDGWVWRAATNYSVVTLNNTASDHLRFNWVHLPDQFGAATIGSVFESAWASDNSSRTVVGCTAFSTYFNATLFTDEYSFWSGWYPWNVEFGHRYPVYEDGQAQNPANGRIAVNDSWLDLLTPPTPPDGPGYYSWQPSTIESILMNAGLQNIVLPNNGSTLTQVWANEDLTAGSKTILLEMIICSVLVDGLSRSGSAKVYSTTDPTYTWALSDYNQKSDFDTLILKDQDAINPPNSPSVNFTKLRIDMKIGGFAYEGSLAEYLAMTVLFVHIAFALSHTIWIICSKETSDSWDSVSKIIVLAQNSRPSVGILKNASANIDHLETYSQKAKIRATQVQGSEDFDHVELIFSGEADQKVNNSHELIEGVNHQVPDVPDTDKSSRVFAESTSDLQFNDRHHYPQTWPGIVSNGNSSTVTFSDPRRSAEQNSTASVLSNKTGSSFTGKPMKIRSDRDYG